jgi:hypothetical protein
MTMSKALRQVPTNVDSLRDLAMHLSIEIPHLAPWLISAGKLCRHEFSPHLPLVMTTPAYLDLMQQLFRPSMTRGPHLTVASGVPVMDEEFICLGKAALLDKLRGLCDRPLTAAIFEMTDDPDVGIRDNVAAMPSDSTWRSSAQGARLRSLQTSSAESVGISRRGPNQNTRGRPVRIPSSSSRWAAGRQPWNPWRHVEGPL